VQVLFEEDFQAFIVGNKAGKSVLWTLRKLWQKSTERSVNIHGKKLQEAKSIGKKYIHRGNGKRNAFH
jgi:hypothetical protein